MLGNCNRPSGSITISDNPANINQNISFTANASGGAGSYSFAWDFDGDGNIDSTLQNPNYTYTSEYQGIVNLNVTDGASCTKSIVVAMIAEPNGGGGGGRISLLLHMFLLTFLYLRYKNK